MRLEICLGDPRRRVDGEDYCPRLRRDTGSLIRPVDDAGQDTLFISDEHVAGLERLLPTIEQRVSLRPKRHIDDDTALHSLQIVTRCEQLVLQLRNEHPLDNCAWPGGGLSPEEDGLQLKLNVVGLAEALVVAGVGMQRGGGHKLPAVKTCEAGPDLSLHTRRVVLESGVEIGIHQPVHPENPDHRAWVGLSPSLGRNHPHGHSDPSPLTAGLELPSPRESTRAGWTCCPARHARAAGRAQLLFSDRSDSWPLPARSAAEAGSPRVKRSPIRVAGPLRLPNRWTNSREAKSFLTRARPNTGRTRVLEPAPPQNPAMTFKGPST